MSRRTRPLAWKTAALLTARRIRVVAAAAVALGALALAPPAAAIEAEDRLQFADALYSRAMYDMAVREYEAFLRDFPETPKADSVLFRIAESQRLTGSMGAAERAYARVVAEHPRSPFRFRAAFRLAELQRDGGREAEAVATLRMLLKDGPPADLAAAARYALGDMALRRNDAAEAAAMFEAVVRDPTVTDYHPSARLALAGILVRADPSSLRAAELYASAAEAPGTNRIAPEALFQLGELRFRRKEFALSARAYGQLFARHPDDPRVPEARLQAAWADFYAGLYADCLRRCTQSVTNAAAGDRPEWLYLQANARRQLMDEAGAVRTYAELIAGYPKHRLAPFAAYEQAAACFRSGRFSESISSARPLAAEAGPLRRDVYWLLAESYAALKQPDDAIQFYRLFADQYPSDPLAPDARFRLARLLQERGDPGQAAALFEAAAGTNTTELAAQALFAAAACLARTQRHEAAVRNWGLVVQRFPRSPYTEESLYQKGMTEAFLRRDADAIATLRDLLTRYPATRHLADANHWIGTLLLEAGRPADAEPALRAALAAQPPPELAQKVRLRLASVLQKLGQPDEAAALLQELVDSPARPELSPELMEWLAEYRIQRREFDRAVAPARLVAVATNDPSWAQIGWSLAGRAWMGLGRSAEAEQAFSRALAVKAATPYGAEAALRLGEIAIARTNHASAVRYLEQAAQLASDERTLGIRVQAYAALGRAARARGDAESAARYFMAVALLFDDAELVPECLRAAADSFDRLGRAADRDKALAELKRRYPESRWNP